MILRCKQCGYDGQPSLEHAGPHIKAVCKKCGMYIKFVPYSELGPEDIDELKRWVEKQDEPETINLRLTVNQFKALKYIASFGVEILVECLLGGGVNPTAIKYEDSIKDLIHEIQSITD